MPDVWVEELDEISPQLLQALTDIEQEAFGKGGMNDWFLPPFVRQGRVFVLWAKGKNCPIGVAECMRNWDRPKAVYLFGFAIRKDMRGKGFGTLFIREICRRLRERGFASIELTVSGDNGAALHIYRNKLGFCQLKEYANEYGPGKIVYS